MWVEIAVSFVQVAMSLASPKNLSNVPANVGVLRWFISKAGLQDAVGMNDSRYLAKFFGDGVPEVSIQSKSICKLSPKKEKKLKNKPAEDERKNVAQSNLQALSKEPYWD